MSTTEPPDLRSPGGPLAHALIDDAAIFPPGNASLPVAVEQHLAHRTSWYGPSIGPLLVRLADTTALNTLVTDESPVAVALVCPPDAGADALAAGAADVRRGGRAVVTAIEQPALAGLDPARVEVAAALGVRFWAELPQSSTLDGTLDHRLDDVAAAGAGAKYRTGGVQPQAFPTEQQLARFIRACVARDLPFKLTAGLHHAVRHTARATATQPDDLEQHGLANVVNAVASALDAGTEAQLVSLLAERDPERVSAMVAELDTATVRRVRRLFTSFGCCGVTDPVLDLVTLDLLDPGPFESLSDKEIS